MSGGSLIAQGRFAIPEVDGLVPGPYKVAVYSADTSKQTTGTDLPEGDVPPARERIPSRYNQKTTLTAQVEKGSRNIFTFDLKSQ